MNTAKARERLIEAKVNEPTRTDVTFSLIRKNATMMVPGVGNTMAFIVVVGEGPGAEEDRTGLPFVGPAGELLTRLLVGATIDRTRCWITNLMKYRCTNSNGEDRPPYRPESVAAKRYLAAEIDIINPRLVVLCGRTALEAVRPGRPMREMANTMFSTTTRPDRIYLVTYHPAACLRDESLLEQTQASFRLIPDRIAL